MYRTSRSVSSSITPHPMQARSSDPDVPLNPADVQIQLQDCARRKDWPALQNGLTAYPDTYLPDRDSPDHPVLELDLADARELGDFAAHLPPDAHLPTVVVRGTQLGETDQRIAQLTAHRHSYGLRLENCTLGYDAVECLAEGARQGQEAGHTGLRVLAWTNTKATNVNDLFSVGLEETERSKNAARCGCGESNIGALISQSPHLETFALSGLAPVESDPNAPDEATLYGIIKLGSVLGALAGSKLKHLHLDNFSSDNFVSGTESDSDAESDGWQEWANSSSVAIGQVRLTRWCLDSTDEGTLMVKDGLSQLLSARGLSHGDHGPIRVECSGLGEALQAGLVLGQALRQRNAETTVHWDLCGTPSALFAALNKNTATDFTWARFSDELLAAEPDSGASFGASLSLALNHPHASDLDYLQEGLQNFDHLTSLTVQANGDVEQAAATNAEIFKHREKTVVSLLTRLEEQKYLLKLDLGSRLSTLALERAHAGLADPKVNPDQQLSDGYQQLQSQIAKDVKRDRIAQKMIEHGLDLGYVHPLDRDVAHLIAGFLGDKRGELGETLLSVGLIDQAHAKALEEASLKV